MKLKTILDVAKWANWLAAIAQFLGIITNLFPAQPWTPKVLAVQAIVQGLMTSIGGVGHRLSFNEAQVPSARTTEEITNAAVEVRANLIAAAPVGDKILVPSIGETTTTGTKPRAEGE